MGPVESAVTEHLNLALGLDPAVQRLLHGPVRLVDATEVFAYATAIMTVFYDTAIMLAAEIDRLRDTER